MLVKYREGQIGDVLAWAKWHNESRMEAHRPRMLRSKTPPLARRFSVHRLSADFSHRYFTVNDLDYVATDAHIADRVARFVAADVEVAGSSRLDSLLD